MNIETKERGWIGHDINNDPLQFQRNTLVSNGATEVVVSTVGFGGRKSYYETLCFHVLEYDTHTKNADLQRKIKVKANWREAGVSHMFANKMHETVVEEIRQRIESGDIV